MTALLVYFAALLGFILGVVLMCVLELAERKPGAPRAYLGAVPIYAAIVVLGLGVGLCAGLAIGGAA